MVELSESKEQKEERTKVVQEEREKALTEMGIALKDDGGIQPQQEIFLNFLLLFIGALGVTRQKQPHLLNLNEDPLMSELLLYYLADGKTK